MSNKRKFCDNWLEDDRYKSWICRVDNDPFKASCKLCKSIFIANTNSLKRHKSSKHHSLCEQVESQNTSETCDTSSIQYIKDAATSFEIKMSTFFAEHNISLNSADHLIDLLKNSLPDSEILKNTYLKRTKTKQIIDKIASYEKSNVIEKLKNNQFSLIIDETTDIGTTKCCGIISKYFDKEINKIETRLLGIENIFLTKENMSASGERLFEIIMNYFTTYNIPHDNFIGFASDGASNLIGINNSLVSRLLKQFPGLTVIKCMCHSMHLYSSNASKCLPRSCEDFLRNVYNYFHQSAKRIHQFKEFQEFCDITPHKLLHVSQTRWLSLHAAIKRVLEQWRPLTLYFTNVLLEENLHSIINILDVLKDPSMKLYFTFLNYILPKFNKYNLIFQQNVPTIQILYEESLNLYQELLLCYMKREYITGKTKLFEINPEDAKQYLPLNQIYLGAEIHCLLQRTEYVQDPNMIKNFMSNCRNFLVVSCQQIKKRLPLASKNIEMCKIFKVKNFLNTNSRTSFPTLSDFIAEFPRLNILNIQDIDDEWRNVDRIDIPENIKGMTNAEFFFISISKLKDNLEHFCFSNISNLALKVLSLPTSNVEVERLFSKVNLCKTKSRNKMNVETLTSLIITSELVGETGCMNFKPSNELVKYIQNVKSDH